MSDRDKARILVAEDNQELREMLRVRLEMEGLRSPSLTTDADV